MLYGQFITTQYLERLKNLLNNIDFAQVVVHLGVDINGTNQREQMHITS